jgi:hypothetical protein
MRGDTVSQEVTPMAKPNYRFIKQRKEAARKTRKQEKLEKRAAKSESRPDETPSDTPADGAPPVAHGDAES